MNLPASIDLPTRYEVPHKYVYVLVRADLPLRQQMVQAIHAALEAGYEFRHCRIEGDEHWLCVCTVPNEAALKAAHAHITDHGIHAYMFFEPDEWDRGDKMVPMGMTAIATEPIEKSARKPLKRFPLWSEPIDV